MCLDFDSLKNSSRKKLNTQFTIYIIDFKLIINIFIISEKR